MKATTPESTREAIGAAAEAGLSVRQIAARLGVSKSVAGRWAASDDEAVRRGREREQARVRQERHRARERDGMVAESVQAQALADVLDEPDEEPVWRVLTLAPVGAHEPVIRDVYGSDRRQFDMRRRAKLAHHASSDGYAAALDRGQLQRDKARQARELNLELGLSPGGWSVFVSPLGTSSYSPWLPGEIERVSRIGADEGMSTEQIRAGLITLPASLLDHPPEGVFTNDA